MKYYIILLFAVLAIVLATTIVISRQKKQKAIDADQFLTGRSTARWHQVGFSVLAVVMGSWALFSPAEAAMMNGISAAIGYAVAQGIAIAIFAVLGVKLRNTIPNGSSMTEFVRARFGNGVYYAAMAVSVLYMSAAFVAALTGIGMAASYTWGIPGWLAVFTLTAGIIAIVLYGGMRSSLFSDKVQAIVIIPTLIIVFVAIVSYLGGFSFISQAAAAADSSMMDLGNTFGWEYSLALVLAIGFAGLFDQSYWQRTYAADSDTSVRKGFIMASLCLMPLLFMCGLLGVFAVGAGTIKNQSIAIFELMHQYAPAWLFALLLLLTVCLVVSTCGALVNAISSVISVEIKRHKKNIESKNLIFLTRVIALFVAVVAAIVALFEFSVLYVFLIADLFCAAAGFPIFFGLYKRRLPGWAALVAMLAGIISGAFFFPDPTFATGNLLHAFALAAGVPIVICLIFQRAGQPVDLKALNEKIIIVREEDEAIARDMESSKKS